MSVKVDAIKLHKDANALMESGKYNEARDLFTQVAELYFKNQNYFGSAEMNYKAGECSNNLKEYQKAADYFTKAADISFSKAFERYGLSALENARDSYKALGNQEKVDEINKKISDMKKKNEQPEEESSFSVFS
jgi:tetratricopeptide (TPR) repeat protein